MHSRMNAIVTPRANNPDKRVCRHCRAPIDGALHARERGEFCCESCFFAAPAPQTLPVAVNDPPFALAEALVAALDALDAITSDRPYRKGPSFDAARTEILRLGGSQFDRVAVDIFVAEETTLRNMVDLKCGAAI